MAVTPKIRVKVFPQSKLRLRWTPVVPGAPGTNGTDGADGADGAAATIAIGTVTTVAAGDPATVTNVGTSSAAVLDFEIPQGEDGADGGGAGTVTSAAMTVPTGLVVAGSPITTSGTFAVTYDTGYQGYTSAEATKLSGIEALADVTDAGNVGGVLNTTAKGTPIDADRVFGGDSTSSFAPVYATWTQVKAFLKTYFDTLYQPLVTALTTWGGVTRAAGFDTFVASPTWTNFLALVTGEPTFYTSGGTDVPITDGGTGASDAATAFSNLKQAATASATGVVELATDAEAQTGTDTARAVTPANLAAAAMRQGVHEQWIPAGAMKPRATSGAAEGTYDSGSNDVTIPTLDFDTTTQEYAQFHIGMPKGWNEGTVTFIPYWTNTGGSSTQTVRWTLAGAAISNDDSLNATMGTAQNSDDTWLAQNDLHIGPESSAITIGGTPAENDLVVFQISRDVANDNMSGDAILIGIKLRMTYNAGNDA